MRRMRYYKPDVLAMFYNRSEKYEIQTDEFEGRVCISSGYYRDCEGYLDVAFGFRACRNGEWAIAAYGPDLAKSSADEQQFWTGFEIADEKETLTDAVDPRFQKWFDRYIMGSWDVEDGPIASLDRVVQQVNALTRCVVDAPLFSSSNLRSLSFPQAENNHRYQDAHSEVYKVIIDGLNKDAISGLGDKLGIPVNPGGKTTLNALEKLLPCDSVRSAVRHPLDHVSKHRRLADHNERPEPQRFPAFEEFGNDMRAVVKGLEILRDDLAKRLDFNVARCEKRASAMESLPVFDERRPVQADYGIAKAFQMAGKQVVRVQAGQLMSVPGRHEGEALVLEFSDGSLMGIDVGTNISQILRDDAPTKPEDLHIRFYVTYVPPMLPFTASDDEAKGIVEVVD
jgi:hypothetical protein